MGDTDPCVEPDATQEEIEAEEPVFAACQLLVGIHEEVTELTSALADRTSDWEFVKQERDRAEKELSECRSDRQREHDFRCRLAGELEHERARADLNGESLAEFRAKIEAIHDVLRDRSVTVQDQTVQEVAGLVAQLANVRRKLLVVRTGLGCKNYNSCIIECEDCKLGMILPCNKYDPPDLTPPASEWTEEPPRKL
jgi:hypothetical protein